MAKMKKRDIRRQSILNDLLNQDCCTYEYLMNHYDISERAMQMDIKELCKQGYKIKGIKAKRGYVLTQEKETSLQYYESTDLQKIRKLFILQILQNSYNGHTINEITKLLEDYNCNGIEEKIEEEPKETADVDLEAKKTKKDLKTEKLAKKTSLQETGRKSEPEEKKKLKKKKREPQKDNTTIKNALKELVEAKMAAAVEYKDEEGKQFAPTRFFISANAPLQLAFSEEEAMEILNLLETCSKGHHHEKILEEIQKKLKIALWFDPEDERKTSSAYVVYNKSFETAGKLEELLQELNRYPFEQKVLQITYINRLQETVTIPFAVGDVVYSVDKDKLYLLGESQGTPLIVQYSTITKIEVTEEANKIFRNLFYTNIVKDMFAISIEKQEFVQVEFDDVFAIKEKLSRLLVNRPNAKLYEKNEKLYYEDCISGLYDFANYLRRYGSCCKVLKPLSLRELMKASANRILENYERLEEELKNGQTVQ